MMTLRMAVIALVLLLVTACDEPGDDGIRLSGWVSSPYENDAMQSIVEGFRAEYPDANLAYHPIQANYIEKIQLMLGTGTAPDVFMLEAFWAPSLIEYDTLLPLDEFAQQDPEFDLADFEPVLLDAFRRDGKLYGIPKDYSTVALFYNPEMLAAAGYTHPPRDWHDLATYAKRLTVDTDNDGEPDQFGLAISESLEAILPFIWQNGGHLVDDSNQIDLADKNAVEAIQFLKDLHTDKIAAIPTDLGASWNMEAFGRKRVAMAVSGLWALNFLDTTFADTPYDVAALPVGEQASSIAYVVGYVIPRQTSNPREAWELLKYLTGKEGQSRWAELDIGLPPRTSIVEETRLMEDPTKRVFVTAAQAAGTWQLGSDQRLLDELQTAMQAVFLTDTQVDEALERADRRLQR